jgi:hypothetical protein
MMQMTADEFERLMGRHPLYDEFTNVYSAISSFQQGVTKTNKVTQIFDNSGGWLYDAKIGKISINSGRKYAVGIWSWIELSKIDFRSKTIEVAHNGKSDSMDYSYFNEHLNAYRPQIDDVITNWAATNMKGVKKVKEVRP